ncbi:hypothetical protein RYH80_04190 [Halobaculum sp. MBLA0147]|uniref:hypothetical protein n=1 Tax=Halobaculum sp. MBLA0147 TaxID=3079934 RepID=UPI00352582AC
MPDTKRGREREGRKKREQLEARLTEQELEALDDDDELPEYPPEDLDADLVDPEGTEREEA